MIRVIDDPIEILKLHERFQNQLSKYLTQKINCWVGYPSGSFEDEVRYSKELNIWISTLKHNNKYWNGFGIGKPVEHKNNSLNGEINYPNDGISRRIAGAFGIEENGKIILLHRGKIGGGTKGIGKVFFTDNFRGDFVNALDGTKKSRFCVVGELDSAHFPEQVANFIKEIYRVKELIKNPSVFNFDYLNDFKFTNEQSGVSIANSDLPRVIERTHGIIVNALAKELESIGYKVGNDRNRDLFTYKNRQIENLFEVKTVGNTQSLYSALGQLIIYSIPIPNKVNLFMVLPTQLSRLVTEKLMQLGIEIIYYHWRDDIPKFANLEECLLKVSG